MPIVSKELINLGEQADGTFRVREEHTDTLGVVWTFQYRAPFLVAQDPPDGTSATEIMNARDLIPQLRDRDFEDVRSHVAQGFPNDPSTFEYTRPLRDITELEAEVEVVSFAANAIGDEAQPFAWFIQNLVVLSWQAIELRLGYTRQEGDAVRDRMTAIIAAAPLYNETRDDSRGIKNAPK